MKRPIVFSLIKEQSRFMTAIMSLLSFLSILTLGVALAIGTGVTKWNSQWELFATVQVTNQKNVENVQKIIKKNTPQIESVNEITTQQMQDLMSPWISGGNAIQKYLPKMWEIKFKTESDLKSFGTQVKDYARFLTHANALQSATSAGWKMILMSGFILILMLGAIGFCISYIAQNTAMLHKRELEILNQIGASDNFVARQMQFIVAKISAVAALIGLVAATPILMLIISVAHGTRVGLMATIGLTGFGWLILCLLPVAIVIFAIQITRRTTINILKNS
ncbi:MAG: cell division protein FtsX [Alphaproteobacteria bacterium]